MSAGDSELELKASLKEARFAHETEPIKGSVAVDERKPDVVQTYQFTIGVNRQNVPPVMALAVEIGIAEVPYDFPMRPALPRTRAGSARSD